MLIQTQRPKEFNQVRGNQLVIKALQGIVKDPVGKPQSILLQGERGTGKTTLAYIFAKALNCKISKNTLEPCNVCSRCTDSVAQYFTDYDCAEVGNVKDMDQVKNMLAISIPEKFYRVVVFDEFQLASTQSQASILKLLENPPINTFILFCTTDPNKILDTIISRSLVLDFTGLTNPEILELLESTIAHNKLPELKPETLKIIVRRVKGHARDALSMLDKIYLIGEDAFIENYQPLDSLIYELILLSLEKRVTEATSRLDLIIKNPVMYIEQDFEHMFKILCKSVYLDKKLPFKVQLVINTYLTYHQNLSNTSTWYSFFTHIINKLSS